MKRRRVVLFLSRVRLTSSLAKAQDATHTSSNYPIKGDRVLSLQGCQARFLLALTKGTLEMIGLDFRLRALQIEKSRAGSVSRGIEGGKIVNFLYLHEYSFHFVTRWFGMSGSTVMYHQGQSASKVAALKEL